MEPIRNTQLIQELLSPKKKVKKEKEIDGTNRKHSKMVDLNLAILLNNCPSRTVKRQSCQPR
jgi:hypothetical protein